MKNNSGVYALNNYIKSIEGNNHFDVYANTRTTVDDLISRIKETTGENGFNSPLLNSLIPYKQQEL